MSKVSSVVIISMAFAMMVINALILVGQNSTNNATRKNFYVGLVNGLLAHGDCTSKAAVISEIARQHKLSKNDIWLHMGDEAENERRLRECGIVTEDMLH